MLGTINDGAPKISADTSGIGFWGAPPHSISSKIMAHYFIQIHAPHCKIPVDTSILYFGDKYMSPPFDVSWLLVFRCHLDIIHFSLYAKQHDSKLLNFATDCQRIGSNSPILRCNLLSVDEMRGVGGEPNAHDTPLTQVLGDQKLQREREKWSKGTLCKRTSRHVL